MRPLLTAASLVAILLASTHCTAAPVSAASAPVDRCAPPTPTARSITSPDATTTVYVQEDPTRGDQGAVGDLTHEDLCIVRHGAAPRLLFAGRSTLPDAGVETTLADLYDLRFASDGTHVYFTSAAWVVGKALHEVDLTNGIERFVTDGALDLELTRGPFKGDLVVVHFLLDPDHEVTSPEYRGRMVLHFLHTKDGVKVRRLPEDDAARRKVLSAG